MYEAKYSRYITKSEAKFAEPEDFVKTLRPISAGAVGAPMFAENGELYVDNEDNHCLVIGPTGCKKSRTVGFATVATAIENGESAIINDPKGEIYRRTYSRAKELGADVFVLNFRDPKCSDAWNPLSQIYELYHSGLKYEAENMIDELTLALMAPVKSERDRYWENTAGSFLNALLIVYMLSCPNKNYFNLKNVIPLCSRSNKEIIENLVKCISDNSSVAAGLKSVAGVTAENTLSCLYGVLQTMLSTLSKNGDILDLLSGESSFDFRSFGDKQSILYIIYPDERRGMDFIVNLLLTQSYQTLLMECTKNGKDKLPVRVNYILDEFSNLACIENFDNRISESRSKNIRYFLFVQSYQQLQQKYDELAETIISNCGDWICFSSKDMEFLKKIAAICGKEVDYNGQEHYLISEFDMQYLKKSNESVEVLIIKQGQAPFITELPDFDCTGISEKFSSAPNEAKPGFVIDSKWILSPKQWIKKIVDGEFTLPFTSK